MIYTLEWIKKEAEGIAGHWNGESERFIDASGDSRTDEEAQVASELLDKIKEVEEMIEQLGM
jgi:hypothetical protein